MKNSYRSASITSQFPFCSTPLRIDTYSDCSFGCSYCFAKSRGGNISSSPLSTINLSSLEKRLSRVSSGQINSAIDEMLHRRVPIQLGGMTDPFSHFESIFQTTKHLLRILNDFDYPCLVSTKGLNFIDQEHIELLSKGNYLVRHSVLSVDETTKNIIEKNTMEHRETLSMIENLSSYGINLSIRFQPIIPGYENLTSDLIGQAFEHGAKHVSLEYLKLPIEKNSHQRKNLKSSIPNLESLFLESTRQGREWILPIGYRAPHLHRIAAEHADKKSLIGFAENELLHFNNFESCCNAGDKFLRRSNFLTSNITSAIKAQMSGEIRYDYISQQWKPMHSISTYLNSKSRSPKEHRKHDIEFLLREKWNSRSQRSGPAGYYGIKWTGETDANGNKIFQLEKSPEVLKFLNLNQRHRDSDNHEKKHTLAQQLNQNFITY